MLGLGSGIFIAVVTRMVETSRLAFGPYAFYGNGALIVPAIGSGLAIYALWTWVLRAGRPRRHLAWSALGLYLGLGTGVFVTGGIAIEGLFFTGLLFVVPVALAAFGALTLLDPRLASPGRASQNALVLTLVVLVGLFLAVFPFPPLGVGLIAGAFIAVGRHAGPSSVIGLGALLVAVLLAAGLALPLVFFA